MERVAIIILNYNNYKDTIECIKSVKKNIYPDYEVIMVDNSSTDNSVTKIKEVFKDSITYIETEKNLGYAGGNNVGLRYALKKNFDYMCILNNDTVVDPKFLVECISCLNKNTDIAFVGPVALEYGTNIIQSTGSNLLIKKGWMQLINAGKKKEEVCGEIECDYISGACLVFKTSFLKEHGLIPENYFLFFEETEWCYTAKKKGYRNVCTCNTYIEHKGSVSINKVEGLSAYLGSRNRVVFYKRNISNGVSFFVFLIYLFLGAGYSAVREKNLKYIRLCGAYVDGVINRVSKKYPFVLINDNKGC